jgi:hypothetical protein
MLATVLALPASAAAPANGTYVASKVQLGYKLSFQLVGGKVTKLRAVVLENCTGESTSRTTTIASDASWPVRGGRFSKRIRERIAGVTAYTTFEGRITGRAAAGTVRQETIVAGAVCDTYKLRWTAARH